MNKNNKIKKLLENVRTVKMVLNPFDKKYYPDGHVFENPFAEIRKINNL